MPQANTAAIAVVIIVVAMVAAVTGAGAATAAVAGVVTVAAATTMTAAMAVEAATVAGAATTAAAVMMITVVVGTERGTMTGGEQGPAQALAGAAAEAGKTQSLGSSGIKGLLSDTKAWRGGGVQEGHV